MFPPLHGVLKHKNLDDARAVLALLESFNRSQVMGPCACGLVSFGDTVLHGDPHTGVVHCVVNPPKPLGHSRIVPYVFGCAADGRLWQRLHCFLTSIYAVLEPLEIHYDRDLPDEAALVAAGRRMLAKQPLARLTWRRFQWLALYQILV